MIALLLQATPPALPPSTPWQAAVAATIALSLITTAGLVLVARRTGKKDDGLGALKKTLVEHGQTLAAHGKRLDDIESALADGTDPDVRHREAQRTEDRVAALEKELSELRRETRERSEARHLADKEFAAQLGRIEGFLRAGTDRRS